MKNIFINNYRRNKKAKTIIDQTDNLYFMNYNKQSKDTNPESILATKELQHGINKLDSDFRRAFDMYNDGYKYKEIADDLDLTIGTVKSRIFYSRKKLMENLREYQPTG
jgi:RNA polymerase sigma-70 factor (ECF subfamily)